MTPKQIELARHALGLSGDTKVSYRRHFVTGPDTVDYPHWIEMVASGDARRRDGTALTGGDDLFLLTRKGAEAALKPGERLSERDFPL